MRHSIRIAAGRRTRDLLSVAVLSAVLPVLANRPTRALGQTTNPSGAIESFTASVTIPFTVAFDNATIVQALNDAAANQVQEANDSIRTEIIAAVNAQADAIKAKNPNFFTSGYNATIDNLVNQADTQINNASATIKTDIAKGVNSAAASLESKIKKLTPKVILSSRYQFVAGQEDPGNPGWSEPPDARFTFNNLTGKGSIGVDLSVNLEPAGIGIEIPITMKATIEVSAVPTAVQRNISPVNSSTATASAIPGIDLDVSIDLEEDAGLTWDVGGSLGLPVEFDPVSGTIVAGQNH
jgi:hypothetical protein